MRFSKILINLISMSEKFDSLKFLWHVAFKKFSKAGNRGKGESECDFMKGFF